MTVADWLASVTADAGSRGLAELVPLLETLARSTEALRAADAEFGHPAAESAEKNATEHADSTDKKATQHTQQADKGSDGRN